MSSKTVNFASLSKSDIDAMMAQLQAVTKDRRTQVVHTYGEHLAPLVTSVVENEEYATSAKSDWAGYRVNGIPVVIEGHTFTVSVTITDTQAKQAREQARKVEEARALVAKAEAEANAAAAESE